jgi:SAM-dependent MidA family methyltransferase
MGYNERHMKLMTDVLSPLEQKIIDRIQKEGPITFKAFMDMALYEPGLGYYSSEDTEIGRAGDFYTSQHLHPSFGALIARQIEEMWQMMGKPADFHIVEPGAGAGLMCMDIMHYLDSKEIFQSLAYIIAEVNPSLEQKQKKLLDRFTGRISWVSSLKELGEIRGCVLSNELLDAFPVHLIEMQDKLYEIYVTFDSGDFREIKGPPSTKALTEYLNDFSVQLPKGYRTEINLRIKDWLETVGAVLSQGFVLTIDYGYPAPDYYSEERSRGTLLCYYRHQVNENPYINIGEQDMTAHVNFSSLRKWGEEFGFSTLGFCQQGTFLISLGVDEIIRKLHENSKDYLFEVAKIKRLIFPGTLGETHKVMIQYKGEGAPQLRGFAMKNRKDRL